MGEVVIIIILHQQTMPPPPPPDLRLHSISFPKPWKLPVLCCGGHTDTAQHSTAWAVISWA